MRGPASAVPAAPVTYEIPSYLAFAVRAGGALRMVSLGEAAAVDEVWDSEEVEEAVGEADEDIKDAVEE